MRFLKLILSFALCGASVSSALAFPKVEMPADVASLKHDVIYPGNLVSEKGSSWRSVVRIYSDGGGCSATIISAYSLLTAAHCIQGTIKYMEVAFFVGADVTNVKAFTEGEFLISSLAYRKGSPNEVDRDMAVITFNTMMIDNEHQVMPVVTTEDESRIDLGRKVYFIGAGTKGNKEFSSELRFTSGTITTYGASSVGVRATPGTGVCPGDSGGALTILVGEEHRLLGVTSSFYRDGNHPDQGRTCGGTINASFVSGKKSDWISQTTEKHMTKLSASIEKRFRDEFEAAQRERENMERAREARREYQERLERQKKARQIPATTPAATSVTTPAEKPADTTPKSSSATTPVNAKK